MMTQPFLLVTGGAGLLGIVGWAQKLYLLSQVSLFALPEDFSQLGNTFSWSVANLG